jgi:prefoldin subunit 5
MSDDLVKRLRSKIIVHTDAAVWMLEAADRIEELEAENENLKANLTHLRQTCQRAWDKCDEERVKLAMAVEALKFYAYFDDDQGIRARKILEEMGESDE